MITFPIAKINLGLNVVEKRSDGYHNLQTVFYPVPIMDALEVVPMSNGFPSDIDCDLKVTNIHIEGDEQKNLVVRAYQLLKQDFPTLPRIHVHLWKGIPTQAGMGGGSSDCGYMIRLLNELFELNLSDEQMAGYAAKLGADCAFFITAEPSFATGIGDILSPADDAKGNLHGYYLALVKPDVAVSTREAYAAITPQKPQKCCRDIVRQPIETWRQELTNDFERPVFAKFPQLARIKEELYRMGAVYAQMSGSGSTLFGIFRQEPSAVPSTFPDCFTATMKL
jgi:4-diphosphocytidyl-2-C-methyl-D-erythritol kinase